MNINDNDRIKTDKSNKLVDDSPFTDEIKKNKNLKKHTQTSHAVDSNKQDLHADSRKAVLRVEQGNSINKRWAELEVEYSFNANGTSFTCNALQYRTFSNGSRKGNIDLGIRSQTVWAKEISNDNAIQDGQWHVISGGATVTGNARDAKIWFQYTFDVSGSDPSASTERDVLFTLAPPTINNPGVARTARPTLSGTGVAGATVKLYQAGVGTIVFATAKVQDNNTWTAPLTESLWMADPFEMTAMQTLNTLESGWANTTSFAVLFKPVISTVTVSPDRKPTVSGTGGLPGANLQIWLSGGHGGVQLQTNVRHDGTWSVTATTAWPSNRYSITAKQIAPVTKQESDWALDKEFTVPPSQ